MSRLVRAVLIYARRASDAALAEHASVRESCATSLRVSRRGARLGLHVGVLLKLLANLRRIAGVDDYARALHSCDHIRVKRDELRLRCRNHSDGRGFDGQPTRRAQFGSLAPHRVVLVVCGTDLAIGGVEA